jgi:hypothetical protein
VTRFISYRGEFDGEEVRIVFDAVPDGDDHLKNLEVKEVEILGVPVNFWNFRVALQSEMLELAREVEWEPVDWN